MDRRVLGSGAAALHVSKQGFGCMGITAFYGTRIPDDEAIALIKHAYDCGVTHFDTAEVYTCKEGDETIYNEDVVGKAINACGRDNIQIATKYSHFALAVSQAREQDSPRYFPKIHGDEMTPDMVVAACAASCRRLGVEYVDLYYVHRFHPDVPVEAQATAMKAVKDAGLARHPGVRACTCVSVRCA